MKSVLDEMVELDREIRERVRERFAALPNPKPEELAAALLRDGGLTWLMDAVTFLQAIGTEYAERASRIANAARNTPTPEA